MTGLLFRGARLIDGTGRAARADDVLVQDGRIAAVGPRGSLRPDGATVVDAAGHTLLPGLINLHVHLTSRGVWTQPESRDGQLLRGARNARFSLAWGTTTVRDVGCPERMSQAIRDAIVAGSLGGPRVISCGRIISPTAQGRPGASEHADDAQEMRKAARRLVEEGVDHFKVVATGAGGTPGSNVGAPTYSVEELSVLVAEATRLGKRVAAHCNGTAGMRNAVTAGVHTIEHCGWMGAAFDLQVDDAVTAQIRTKDITVVPTMAVWYRPGYDELDKLSFEQRKMRAVRAERTAAWLAMHRAGVRFATGTDTWDPTQRELELMVAEMGVRPMDAIVAATRDAAVALGAERDLGTLEPGKFADLIEVGGDPSHDIAALRAIRRVWKGGVMVTP